MKCDLQNKQGTYCDHIYRTAMIITQKKITSDISEDKNPKLVGIVF